MKKLILISCICFCTAAPVFAQTANTTSTENISAEPRREFASKTDAFNAYVSRNSAEIVSKTTQQLLDLMQRNMKATHSKLSEATGTAKTDLQKLYDAQLKLYVDVKALSDDALKNAGEISDKLKAFQKTL